jgi:hypothetical protein
MRKTRRPKSQTSSTPKKKAKTLKVVKQKKVKASIKPVEELKRNLKWVIEDRNARQEKFCQLYASDREFFGNGVETYIEVYEPDMSKPNWYKTACAAASRMLSNVKVYTRINELLNSDGLNDNNVDKQLLFLINQHADNTNKVAAIREYNKLKQRITDKIDIKSGGKPITGINYIVPKEPKNAREKSNT